MERDDVRDVRLQLPDADTLDRLTVSGGPADDRLQRTIGLLENQVAVRGDLPAGSLDVSSRCLDGQLSSKILAGPVPAFV